MSKHFIEIKKSHPLFTRLHWVALARAQDKNILAFKNAQGLSCIQLLEDRIIATDGSRVHVSHGEHDFLNGLWHVDKCTKSCIELRYNDDPPKYPDITTVWPTPDATWATLKLRPLESHHYPLARIIRLLPADLTINHNFLAEMLDDQTFHYASIPGINTHNATYLAMVFADSAGRQSGLCMAININNS